MKDPEKIKRRRAANKASRIRSKIDRGDDVSSKDRDFLAKWDSQKQATGRAVSSRAPAVKKRRSKTTPTSPPPPATEQNSDPPSTEQSSSGDGDSSAPADAAPPPPPPPPAVLGSGSGSADWRDKYKPESIGREALCEQAADLYLMIIRKLNAYIEAHDGKPWCSDEVIATALRPAAVMTADSLLPDNFSMEPYHTVVIGTSVAVTQAALAARKSKGSKTAATGQPGSRAGRDVEGSREEERKEADEVIEATRHPDPPPSPADPTVVRVSPNASKEGDIA